MSIRFFDMFSGIGGFRSGLEAAGSFECVGHCEIDKYANKAYNAIYLMLGFSAGGHLAGIWATKQGYYRYGLPKPKHLALAYPVIDLSLNKGVSCQNCLHKDCSGEDLIRYSVFTNIEKDYPVTYLWQGKRDQCISFDNSVVMDKVLKENDVKHKYVVYDDTCHGFGVGMGTCAEGWIDKMIKYFESADEA